MKHCQPLKKQVIMACLITGVYDVNRNTILEADDFDLVIDWATSIKKGGLQAIIFHNCFSTTTQEKYQNENLLFIQVDDNASLSPNACRYFHYLDFLKEKKEQITDVFLTDITDVVLANNPFATPLYQKNNTTLFCGDEPKLLDDEWMKAHSTHLRSNIDDYEAYENKNAKEVLLNCGIIGGKIELIIEFLEKLCILHKTHNCNNNSPYTGDMGAFNYIMRTFFSNQIIHGFPVNTVFKEYQVNRTDCWFRHK